MMYPSGYFVRNIFLCLVCVRLEESEVQFFWGMLEIFRV